MVFGLATRYQLFDESRFDITGQDALIFVRLWIPIGAELRSDGPNMRC